MMKSCGTLDKCRIYTLLTTSNRATRVSLLEKLKKKNKHFTRSIYFTLEVSKKQRSYPNCCSNYHRG